MSDRRRVSTLPLLVGLLAMAPPASAQREEALAAREARDRFELFTECSPVLPAVSVQIASDAKISLTTEAANRAVRSRLRAARIYSDPYPTTGLPAILMVHIGTVGAAFSIRIELLRPLRCPSLHSVVTWNIGKFGTHGNDATFVLGVLSELMDEFIDEYLRVNAAACG